MIANPIDVNTAFPVRKSKVQKQAFRDAVIPYVQALGYECTTEKGMLGARNVVIGNPETAKYLITAHYDTCAHLPFPNLITPCSFWLFMAYQLVIAAFMLLIPLIPTIAADWLFDTGAASSMVWYAFFLLGAILMMVGPANKHNANDNTCEGMDYAALKAFSVAFQPEAHKGNRNPAFVFTQFADLMGGNK